MKILFLLVFTVGILYYVSGQTCSPCTCSGTANVNRILVSCGDTTSARQTQTFFLGGRGIVSLSNTAFGNNGLMTEL